MERRAYICFYLGHSDDEDPAYIQARSEGASLPPLLSEGWIYATLLERIHGVSLVSSSSLGIGTTVVLK